MKVELVEWLGILTGTGLVGGWLYSRWSKKKLAEERARQGSPLMQVATGALRLRPGYVVTEHPWGWSARSGPRSPHEVEVRIPRLDQGPPGPAFVRLVTGREDLPEGVARLLIGGLRERWRWDKGTWAAELGPENIYDEVTEGYNPADLVGWARNRVDEVDELVALTRLGAALTAEQIALIERRQVEDEAGLDALAKTLVEHFAKDHPDAALRIAEHLDSPRLWLELMKAPRLTNRSLATLLTRWPHSDAETRALEVALSEPVRFGADQLALVFTTLERRGDPRLPELLTRLIGDLLLQERWLVLTWLEKRGDTTAIAPLRELEKRCGDEWLEAIEKTIRAIQFRVAEALNHTLGGLSVADGGGSLALSQDTARSE